MRFQLAAVVVVTAAHAFAASSPPAAVAKAAKDLKPRASALEQPTRELITRRDALKQAFTAAGVDAQNENSSWEISRAATRAEFDAAIAERERFERTLTAFLEDCRALAKAADTASIRTYASAATQTCTQARGCGVWADVYAVTEQLAACDREYNRAEFVQTRVRNIEPVVRTRAETREREEVAERAYLQPVTGDAAARRVTIPKSLSYGYRGAMKSAWFNNVPAPDAFFAATHPSHFVFLRKDLARGVIPGWTSEQALRRTLHKGEAVLVISVDGTETIDVMSIDDVRVQLAPADVALAPIKGSKPGALQAKELSLVDDQGQYVVGPAVLEPDSTGFRIKDAPVWLPMLEPAEPRQQQFSDAKEKVVACYDKQLAKTDPDGTLRKHYDFVTYGPGGNVLKMESAAEKLDRGACAACGCKKFNEFKRKLAGEALAPKQKAAFAPYVPVLEKLNAPTTFSAP